MSVVCVCVAGGVEFRGLSLLGRHPTIWATQSAMFVSLIAILTEVREHISVRLICIFLITEKGDYFSCIYWPQVLHLTRPVELMCPFLDWITGCFDV